MGQEEKRMGQGHYYNTAVDCDVLVLFPNNSRFLILSLLCINLASFPGSPHARCKRQESWAGRGRGRRREGEREREGEGEGGRGRGREGEREGGG